jgi:phosphonate transport system substrate-binding protein
MKSADHSLKGADMRQEKLPQKVVKINFWFLSLGLIATLLLIIGCDQNQDVKKISLQKSEKIKSAPLSPTKEKSLKIAVSAMISPQETSHFYKDILDYVSEKLTIPIELVQRETYEEINDLLKKQELDAAFVCSGAYVTGHDEFGMELLVAPVVYGKPVYYSYIIVHQDSPARTLQDLRGESFAFTDPLSNTGKLAPTFMLAQMGENAESFFSHFIFTNNHDASIEAVSKKLVDGAAVDSLIWDYLNVTNPVHTSQTKIIQKSAPYGIPPIVVPKGIDMQMKEELRNIFLHMHEDENGRKILNNIMIDRFIEVSNDMYDSIRTMQQGLIDEK